MNIVPRAECLPTNTALFHYSSNLDQLLQDGYFDPAQSQFDSALFFTDKPSLATNCTVRTAAILHLFIDITPRQEVNYDKKAGFHIRDNGSAHGIDGLIIQNSPDPYTLLEDGTLANEIILFGASAHKLGRVALYTR